MKHAIALFFLILSSMTAFAQTTEKQKSLMLGGFGAVTLNMHKGTFSTFDGLLDCGKFSDATTIGWQAGNIVDYYFSKNIGVSGRLYYYDGRGDFSSNTVLQGAIWLGGSTYVNYNSENELDVSLYYIGFDALFKYNFDDVYYVALGPSLGYCLRAFYTQKETIQEPVGAKFPNGSDSRQISAGHFDETQGKSRNFRIGGTLALGADFPLSENVYLNPEISYTLPFNDVITNTDWQLHTLKAAVGLKFTLGEKEVIIKEAPPPPSEPKEVQIVAKPAPVAALQAKNKMNDGSVLNYAEILLKDELVNDIIPILPYVFFAPNSSELPDRYVRLSNSSTSSFDENQLSDDVIGVYHNLLNIVGKRMQTYGDAKITITGCVEALDDNGNVQDLARSRAQAVKNYLENVWGIEPARISISERALPELPSSRNEPDGREENRRVEISSTDQRVLEPVRIAQKTTDIEPNSVLFMPNMQFSESVANYTFSLKNGDGAQIYYTYGENAPPEMLPWQVNKNNIASYISPKQSLSYLSAQLDYTSQDGKSNNSEVQIPVRRMISSRTASGEVLQNMQVERFNVIFFDFDKPRVSSFNQYLVDFIQQKMRTNSNVTIFGYTDRLGPEGHNLDLSQQRADAISESIRKRIVPESMTSKGVGETLIYDNNLPECRFYNRTVIIEIKTPIGDDFFRNYK